MVERLGAALVGAACLLAAGRAGAQIRTQFEGWFDPRDPALLPDAFAPPSLPDLTHRGAWFNLESSVASIRPRAQEGGAIRSRAGVWLLRGEAETELIRRTWYAGLATEAAYGESFVKGEARGVVAGYPELWTRAVWASRAGLAYGGGVSVVLPVFKRTQGEAAGRIAEAVRVVRPWTFATYAENTITVRPYLDARVIDGPVTLQLRQAFDLQGLVAEVEVPRAGVVSLTTLFFGYRPWKPIGIGLELWEVYFLNASNIPDERRAVFAVSPALRYIGRRLQPAISAIVPFERPLFDRASSYWALRASIGLVLDEGAPFFGLAPP
ncbi:MAG TPA: hypothetical protein VFS43_07385 [Polyangiaceae bacterium]|nr:hypothetical protein [Polyangiaceae bacterium]